MGAPLAPPSRRRSASDQEQIWLSSPVIERCRFHLTLCSRDGSDSDDLPGRQVLFYKVFRFLPIYVVVYLVLFCFLYILVGEKRFKGGLKVTDESCHEMSDCLQIREYHRTFFFYLHFICRLVYAVLKII